MTARLLMMSLLAAGCGTRIVDSCAGVHGACIDVQLESSTIHHLNAIDLHVSGLGVDANKTSLHDNGAAFSLPAAVALVLDSITAQGSVEIDVIGSLGGTVQGSGQTTVAVAPGQHVHAHVVLSGGALPDLSMPGDAAAPTDAAAPDLGPAGCPSGQHACGAMCVSNMDPASCNNSCTPCTAPVGGTATCDGTSCGGTCPSGQKLCVGACIDNAMACSGSCPGGTHDCSGNCFDSTSVNSCGTSCTPCPVPANGKDATCTSAMCGFDCNASYKACGTACIPTAACCMNNDCAQPANGSATCNSSNACVIACNNTYTNCAGTCKLDTDVMSCGPSCLTCPTTLHGTPTCDGTKCDFTCMANYLKSGSSCVACGAENQPCCASNMCNAKLVCNVGTQMCAQKFLTWNTDASGVSSDNFTAVWVSGSGAHYITGQGPVYYSATGNASSWASQTNPLGASYAMFGIWGQSNGVWAGGSAGEAISINGSTWENATGGQGAYTGSAGSDDLTSVWGDSNFIIYFGTSGAKIAILTSGTSAWSTVTPGGVGMSNTFAVWGSGGATPDIYFVGLSTNNKGAVVHKHASTYTAYEVSAAGANGLHGVWGTTGGDVYAVGDNATILHTTVGSDTWTAQTATAAGGASLYGIWGSDTSGYLYAVGDNFSNSLPAVMLHSIGDGTWKAETLPNIGTGNGLYSVYGNTAGTDVFAVGDAGSIVRGQ
jgi:hypothetical protein